MTSLILADSITVEWSTVGVVCGVVFSIVSGIVTLSSVYLTLFVRAALAQQNQHLEEQRTKQMDEIRKDFIQKEALEKELEILQVRLKLIKNRVERDKE